MFMKIIKSAGLCLGPTQRYSLALQQNFYQQDLERLCSRSGVKLNLHVCRSEIQQVTIYIIPYLT